MTDIAAKPVEQTGAKVVPHDGTAVQGAPVQQVVVVPTQIRRPWQATVRTAFQALVALATLIPLVLTDVYDSADSYPAVIVQVVFIAGLVSRIMANPAVEVFLRQFLPFLAAAPPPRDRGQGGSFDRSLAFAALVGALILFLVLLIFGVVDLNAANGHR